MRTTDQACLTTRRQDLRTYSTAGGTGLGLAIALENAVSSRRMDVRGRQAPQRSEIELYLPVVPSLHRRFDEMSRPVKRILIVENESWVRIPRKKFIQYNDDKNGVFTFEVDDCRCRG